MEKKPKLKIIGKDGNAFAILGNAKQAAKKAKWPAVQISKMIEEAMGGDYDHLLQTMTKYFDVS